MNVDPLKITLLMSWIVSTCFVGRRWSRGLLYSLAVIFASASLVLPDSRHKILCWLALSWIGFFIATLEGSREIGGTAQKHFIIQFFGFMFMALGVEVDPAPESAALTLLGVLIAFPSAAHAVFLGKFYRKITRRAFLYSVILPAICLLDFVMSRREVMLSDASDFWPIVPFVLGLISWIVHQISAWLRPDSRSIFVSIALAWLAMLFVVVAQGAGNVLLPFASIATFLIGGLLLYLEFKKASLRWSVFVVASVAGLPGLLGFASVFYCMQSFADIAALGLVMLVAGLIFQSAALIQNLKTAVAMPGRPPFRLVALALVGFFTAIAIHVLGGGTHVLE
jgi:hypothetical protein